MSAWEAAAKERIRQRLSDLRERRDEMEEAKESEIRNLQEEIDFLEEVLSLCASRPPGLKKEDEGDWH